MAMPLDFLSRFFLPFLFCFTTSPCVRNEICGITKRVNEIISCFCHVFAPSTVCRFFHCCCLLAEAEKNLAEEKKKKNESMDFLGVSWRCWNELWACYKLWRSQMSELWSGSAVWRCFFEEILTVWGFMCWKTARNWMKFESKDSRQIFNVQN